METSNEQIETEMLSELFEASEKGKRGTYLTEEQVEEYFGSLQEAFDICCFRNVGTGGSFTLAGILLNFYNSSFRVDLGRMAILDEKHRKVALDVITLRGAYWNGKQEPHNWFDNGEEMINNLKEIYGESLFIESD